MMSHNSTTCTPPLSSYSSAPSIISPPVPLQSTHFVHANVGAYNQLVVFDYKKRLELVDIGQMGMAGNKTGDTKWEALSVAIFTIHGDFSFFQWLQYSDFCHPATPPVWNG
jgi:hypothetical protein